VLLLLAQAAIVTYCRTFSFGTVRQILAALLPVIPGAMYAWDGGIADLRRDAQLVILLTGCLFLSLAYVAAPSWKRGVALGLLFGLTQWSRDNAAAMMAIIALPGIVFAVSAVVGWAACQRSFGLVSGRS